MSYHVIYLAARLAKFAVSKFASLFFSVGAYLSHALVKLIASYRGYPTLTKGLS